MIRLIHNRAQIRAASHVTIGLARFEQFRVVVMIMLLVILMSMIGCTEIQNGSTQQTTETLSSSMPTIMPALSPDLQNAPFQPQRVLIKQNSRFGAWGSQPVMDGWIACGQYYGISNEGQGARLEYYNQDGSLRWAYQRPLSPLDSSYVCAARQADGSVIAGGRTSNEQAPGDPSLGLVTAFDTTGQLLWEQKIDYAGDQNIGLTATRCMTVEDGRILIVLDSDLYFVSNDEGRHPTVIVCLSANGQILWQKEIDFSGMSYSQTAILDDDGGFYLAVHGYRTDDQKMSQEFAWLLRIDRDGMEMWRKSLADDRYQYQAVNLVRDDDGNLLLSCSAHYLGDIPDPPAEPAAFHDRYRQYTYHPAVLLKMDPAGGLIWRHFINGEFGALGQDVAVADDAIYWKVKLTDDIVEPYIFMSIDHRAISHVVITMLNPDGKQACYYQFSQSEADTLQIQRLEQGNPVLIGWEPIPEDPAWTATLPDE